MFESDIPRRLRADIRSTEPGARAGTVVAVQFTAAWVYLLGPVAGGVLAAVPYDRFLSEAETPE